MPKPLLRVVLDDPSREYRAGEALAGRVEVEAEEDTDCEGLRVSLRWETSGDSNTQEGEGSGADIGVTPWKAGEHYTYPFSLEVPPGPPTYEGRRFSNRWVARAQADLPWAIDAKAEAPFTLLSSPAGEQKLVEKEGTAGCQAGCAAFALILLGSGVAMALLARGDGPIFGWIGAGVGLVIALFAVPAWIAHRRMGRVTVEAGPSPAARGDDLACRVILRPRKRVTPTRLLATLSAVEHTVRGSGKHKSTHDEVVATCAVDLDGPESVAAGAEGAYAGLLRVPADAPPTVEAGSNTVKWKVAFTVEIPGLPDPSWEVEVGVA